MYLLRASFRFLSTTSSPLSQKAATAAKTLTIENNSANGTTRDATKIQKERAEKVVMFPELHGAICDAVSESKITPVWIEAPKKTHKKNPENARKEYSTNVMGSFRCVNADCKNKGWSSKKVGILIRGYPSAGYNAQVFSQRCIDCRHLGLLSLDKQSYVERVAYRIKKWAGISVEKPPYDGSGDGPPHEQDLCEGCKRGYCQRGKGVNADDDF